MNPADSKSIVLVDDEKSYVDLLAFLLSENMACPVHAFTQPLEALTAFPNLNAGILVTDYDMPRLNGLELIAKTSQLDPAVPSIIITGRPLSLNAQQHGRYPSLKVLLPKPFGWRTLADEIVRHWPEPNAQLRKTPTGQD